MSIHSRGSPPPSKRNLFLLAYHRRLKSGKVRDRFPFILPHVENESNLVYRGACRYSKKMVSVYAPIAKKWFIGRAMRNTLCTFVSSSNKASSPVQTLLISQASNLNRDYEQTNRLSLTPSIDCSSVKSKSFLVKSNWKVGFVSERMERGIGPTRELWGKLKAKTKAAKYRPSTNKGNSNTPLFCYLSEKKTRSNSSVKPKARQERVGSVCLKGVNTKERWMRQNWKERRNDEWEGTGRKDWMKLD